MTEKSITDRSNFSETHEITTNKNLSPPIVEGRSDANYTFYLASYGDDASNITAMQNLIQLLRSQKNQQKIKKKLTVLFNK